MTSIAKTLTASEVAAVQSDASLPVEGGGYQTIVTTATGGTTTQTYDAGGALTNVETSTYTPDGTYVVVNQTPPPAVTLIGVNSERYYFSSLSRTYLLGYSTKTLPKLASNGDSRRLCHELVSGNVL